MSVSGQRRPRPQQRFISGQVDIEILLLFKPCQESGVGTRSRQPSYCWEQHANPMPPDTTIAVTTFVAALRRLRLRLRS